MKKTFIFMGLLATSFAIAQNVGINTDTPEATLTVKSKTGKDNTTKNLELQNADNTKMVTVLDNGFVGINQPAPTNQLHIKGTAPLRVEGLGTSTTNTDKYLVVDTDGVVKTTTTTPATTMSTTNMVTKYRYGQGPEILTPAMYTSTTEHTPIQDSNLEVTIPAGGGTIVADWSPVYMRTNSQGQFKTTENVGTTNIEFRQIVYVDKWNEATNTWDFVENAVVSVDHFYHDAIPGATSYTLRPRYISNKLSAGKYRVALYVGNSQIYGGDFASNTGQITNETELNNRWCFIVGSISGTAIIANN